jgi:hypothetical protein
MSDRWNRRCSHCGRAAPALSACAANALPFSAVMACANRSSLLIQVSLARMIAWTGICADIGRFLGQQAAGVFARIIHK